MKTFAFLLAAAVTILATDIASAQEDASVPERLRGIWNLGQCTDNRAAVLLGADFALLFETTEDGGAAVTMGPVKWSGGTAVMWRDDTPIILPPPDAMRRCEALPAAAYASIPETVALLLELDELTAECRDGTGESCIRTAFAFADVSGDDELSSAELGRLIRAMSGFIAYETALNSDERRTVGSYRVPIGSMAGTNVVASLAGPVLTRSLLASYDFDGNGFLSLEELMVDREPLFDASLSAAVGASVGTAAAHQLMSTIGGFLASNAGSGLGGLALNALR